MTLYAGTTAAAAPMVMPRVTDLKVELRESKKLGLT